MLIGVAALNTGNNLLYVIVAAMLAAILVSGVASAVVLRDLELDIRLPDRFSPAARLREKSCSATAGAGWLRFPSVWFRSSRKPQRSGNGCPQPLVSRPDGLPPTSG